MLTYPIQNISNTKKTNSTRKEVHKTEKVKTSGGLNDVSRRSFHVYHIMVRKKCKAVPLANPIMKLRLPGITPKETS